MNPPFEHNHLARSITDLHAIMSSTLPTPNFRPVATTPGYLNRFQTKVMVDSVMLAKLNSQSASNHSARNTTNSDGSRSSQSYSTPIIIPRPYYTIKALIKMAIEHSPKKAMRVGDIIDWISKHFLYYQKTGLNWQGQVRAALSSNECFLGMNPSNEDHGNGLLWTIVPENCDTGDSIAVPHVRPRQAKNRNGGKRWKMVARDAMRENEPTEKHVLH